jgi:hypothetical protein
MPALVSPKGWVGLRPSLPIPVLGIYSAWAGHYAEVMPTWKKGFLFGIQGILEKHLGKFAAIRSLFAYPRMTASSQE